MPDWERPSSPSARYVPAQPIAAAEEAPSVYLMAAMSDASAGAELLTPASSPLANVVGKATATMTSERVPHAVQQPLPVIDAVMRDNIRHSIFREDECIACICLLCKTPMSRNYLKPHFRGKQCRNAAAVAPNDLGALSDEAQDNPVEGIHFIVAVPNPLVPPHKRVHLDSQAINNIKCSIFRSRRMLVAICLVCKRPFSSVHLVKNHVARRHLPKLGMLVASRASVKLGTHYLTNVLNPLCFPYSSPSATPTKDSVLAPAEVAEATSASRPAASVSVAAASPTPTTASAAPVSGAAEASSASPAPVSVAAEAPSVSLPLASGVAEAPSAYPALASGATEALFAYPDLASGAAEAPSTSPASISGAAEAPPTSSAEVRQKEESVQLDSEMIAQIRASRLAGDDVIPCICLLCKKPMLERYLKPHLHNVHVGDRTSLPDASKVLSFEGEHALYGVVNPLLTEKDRSRLDLETVRKIRLSNCSSSRFIRTICLLCKTPYQGVFFDIGKHVRTVHWNQQARSKKRPVVHGVHYLRNVLNPLLRSTSSSSTVVPPVSAREAAIVKRDSRGARGGGLPSRPRRSSSRPRQACLVDSSSSSSSSSSSDSEIESLLLISAATAALVSAAAATSVLMSAAASTSVLRFDEFDELAGLAQVSTAFQRLARSFSPASAAIEALVEDVEQQVPSSPTTTRTVVAPVAVENTELVPASLASVDADIRANIGASKFARHECLRFLCLACKRPFASRTYGLRHVGDAHAHLLCKRRRLDTPDHGHPSPQLAASEPEQGKHYLLDFVNPLVPIEQRFAFDPETKANIAASRFARQRSILGLCLLCKQPIADELSLMDHLRIVHQQSSPTRGTHYVSNVLNPLQSSCSAGPAVRPQSPEDKQKQEKGDVGCVADAAGENTRTNGVKLGWKQELRNRRIRESDFASVEVIEFWCELCSKPLLLSASQQHMVLLHPEMLQHPVQEGVHYRTLLPNPLVPASLRPRLPPAAVVAISTSPASQNTNINALCLLCPAVLSDTEAVLPHFQQTHASLLTPPLPNQHYVSNILNPLLFERSGPPLQPAEQALNRVEDGPPAVAQPPLHRSSVGTAELLQASAQPCPPLTTVDNSQASVSSASQTAAMAASATAEVISVAPADQQALHRVEDGPTAFVHPPLHSSSFQTSAQPCPPLTPVDSSQASVSSASQTAAIAAAATAEVISVAPADQQALHRVEDGPTAVALPPLHSSSVDTAELLQASAQPCPPLTPVDDSQASISSASQTAVMVAAAAAAEVISVAPADCETAAFQEASDGAHAQLLLELAQDSREQEVDMEASNLVARAEDSALEELVLTRRESADDKFEPSYATSSASSALATLVEGGSESGPDATAAAAVVALANPRLLSNLRESKFASDECIRFICLECQMPFRDRVRGKRHLWQQHQYKRLKLRRQPGGFQPVLPVENQHFLLDVCNPLLPFADLGRHLPEPALNVIAANETYAERRCLPALCLLCHCPLGSRKAMLRHIERHHDVPRSQIARGVHYELNLMNPLVLRRESRSQGADANAGSRSFSAQGLDNIRSSVFASDECLELYCLLCEKPMNAKSGRLERHMLNLHHLHAIEGETFLRHVPNPLVPVEQRPALVQDAIDNISASEYADEVLIPGLCLLCNVPYKAPAQHVSYAHLAAHGKRRSLLAVLYVEPRNGEHFLRNLLNPLMFSRSSTHSAAAFHPQTALEDASAVAEPAASEVALSSTPVDKGTKPSLSYLALRHLKESEMAGDECIRCICLLCETPLLFVGEPLLHVRQHLRTEHQLEAIENDTYMLDVVNPLVPPSKRASLSQQVLDAISASSWASATCIPGICLICETVCVDAADHVRLDHASPAPKIGVDFLRHVLNPLRDSACAGSPPSTPLPSPVAAGDSAASPLWSRAALAELRSSDYCEDECLPFRCLLCETYFPNLSRGIIHISRTHRIEVPVENEHYRVDLTNPLVSASDRVSLDQETLDNIAASAYARDKCLFGVCLHCKLPLKAVVRHVRVIHKGADRRHPGRCLPEGLEPVRGVDFHLNLLNPLMLDVASQPQSALLDDRAFSEEEEAQEPQPHGQEWQEQLDAEVVANLAASSYASRECIRCLCLLCKQPFGGATSDLLVHVRNTHRRGKQATHPCSDPMPPPVLIRNLSRIWFD